MASFLKHLKELRNVVSPPKNYSLELADITNWFYEYISFTKLNYVLVHHITSGVYTGTIYLIVDNSKVFVTSVETDELDADTVKNLIIQNLQI